VVGYALVMGALAVGLRLARRTASRPRASDARHRAGGLPGGLRGGVRAITRPGPGWPRLILHCLATAAGGYLLLMIIDILYYYGVARVAGSFIESGFTGCAMLVGLSVPLFLAGSWLAERQRWRF